MARVVAIIQARMGSTRLPGKVLREAAGRPLILHMLERVSRATRLDAVWLATTDRQRDDVLAEVVAAAGYAVFRGDEEDVLGRYHALALRERASVVVRLTGDCPLHDPQVIDEIVGEFLAPGRTAPLFTNARDRTYPVGLDTEVFEAAALHEAAAQAESPHAREHVTPHLYREGAEVVHVKLDADFSHLRWTLDTVEDYALIAAIFDALYPVKPTFGWLDVLALVTQRPELLTMNRS